MEKGENPKKEFKVSMGAIYLFTQIVNCADELSERHEAGIAKKKYGFRGKGPSIRAIARKIGVTHATVISNLNLIETHFKQQPLDYLTLKPTAFGRKLSQWARGMISEYEAGFDIYKLVEEDKAEE